MKARFDTSQLTLLRNRLDQHPVYGAVQTMSDLRLFMECHIFSVWDFMSVIKYLQQQIAPASYPWVPLGNPTVRYFINQLVLEEESDQAPPGGRYAHASHFELYLDAMREVGANPDAALSFVPTAARDGMDRALALGVAPAASVRFMESTFGFLKSGKPHVVAAAFALGREHIIPGMFRSFLKRMGMSEQDAPTFHFYLNRHIHLDADFHGPISLQLLDELCDGDEIKLKEAGVAASAALEARIRFWDDIHAAIVSGHQA